MSYPESEYRLPFNIRDHPLVIMQGWNGPWSHKIYISRAGTEQDLTHAIDFVLPIDSEILAARSGIVTGLVAASTTYYDGSDPEIGNNLSTFATNRIRVEHNDGTLSYYSHLRHLGTLVKRGTAVEPGQILGYTGLSGWVGDKPHLHFMVCSGDKSIPFRFADYSGPLEHSELFPESK